MMELVTAELRAKLLHNNKTAREFDHYPVVKFFLPGTNMTWLFSEMEQDGDTLFGLCDLGMQSPELGYASLSEMQGIRVRGVIRVERDRHWTASAPLSRYARAARASGAVTDIL